MTRYLFILAVSFLYVPSLVAQPLGDLAEDEKLRRGVRRYHESNLSDIEWSTSKRVDGNSETVTRLLHKLSGSKSKPLILEEETKTQIDENTTRIVRTNSSFDSRGRTRVNEVIEEDHRILADGSEEIERNFSTPDANGRLAAYRQERQIQEPAGEGATRTSTSIFLRNSSGEFVEREKVEMLATVSGDVTEVQETKHAVDSRGRWTPLEQRTSVITEKDGAPEYQEEHIYRKDSTGKLSLSEQIIKSYEKDSRGNAVWTVEKHSKTVGGVRRNRSGRLELDQRVKVTHQTLPGGVEKTIEEVEERNPGNPSEGLRLVRRTVTTSRPVAGGERELEVEVKGRDGNGRLKTVMNQTTIVSN